MVGSLAGLLDEIGLQRGLGQRTLEGQAVGLDLAGLFQGSQGGIDLAQGQRGAANPPLHAGNETLALLQIAGNRLIGQGTVGRQGLFVLARLAQGIGKEEMGFDVFRVNFEDAAQCLAGLLHTRMGDFRVPGLATAAELAQQDAGIEERAFQHGQPVV